MSDKPIRVKDRRMFTTDGELREEYREIMSRPPEEKSAAAAAPPPPAAPAAPAAPAKAAAPKAPEPVETASGATFQELVTLLAQTAITYLQQAPHVPLEHQAEVAELARMHIDLLVVLKAKTAGNLDAREQAMLDDVLYRLRLAAVERA